MDKTELSFKLTTLKQLYDLAKVIDVASSCSITTLVIKNGEVKAMNDKSTVMNYVMEDTEQYKDLSLVITDIGAFKKRVSTFTTLIKTQGDEVQFNITGLIDQELAIIKSLSFVCKQMSLKMTHACGSASFLKRLPVSIVDTDVIASYDLNKNDRDVIKAGLSAYNADTILFDASGVEFNINVNEHSNKFSYSMTLEKAVTVDNSIKVDLGVFKQIMSACSSIIMYNKVIEFNIDGIKLYLSESLK